MRIKNRLFPYPVLNNNKQLSDYKSGVNFELSFNADNGVEKDNTLFFKDIHIQSSDELLTKLLEENRVKGVLIIECSESIFREKYELTAMPKDIIIPIDKFKGDVEISAFVYAAEDINEFANENFLSDYTGYNFKVDKYCILAADDGFIIKVNKEPETVNKKSSIFTITCKRDVDDNLITYQMGERKIIIYLPEKYYNSYNVIKTDEHFLNASFATIAIPVLTECLMNIRNKISADGSDATIDDACIEYGWFRSVYNAYRREKNRDLTEDVFFDTNPMEIAQIVLNNASCNGIEDINTVVIGTYKNREEDSDE